MTIQGWGVIASLTGTVVSLLLHLRTHLQERPRLRVTGRISRIFDASLNRAERLEVRIDVVNLSKRPAHIAEIGLQIDPVDPESRHIFYLSDASGTQPPIALSEGQLHCLLHRYDREEEEEQLADEVHAYVKTTVGKVYRLKLNASVRHRKQLVSIAKLAEGEAIGSRDS